ncbi:MAG: heat-inducible transcriptional repressor HrcA [Clostridiales bacterium]|nr:heat-inducible transcriptional repressor HrcA [Clostridiales bacterium]
MELDERKFKILEAVIRNYLITGEPAGSRTISKDPDLSLSSATIRNEMADLEDMGYIIQPHTSAGRVPTDKGYRLYVDSLLASKEKAILSRQELLKKKEKEIEAIRREYESRMEEVEGVMRAVARTLAQDTNYATVVSSPMGNTSRIKFIQLSKLEERKLLVVIVLDGNVIRNKVFMVSEEISDKNILKLNMMLNTTVAGITLDELEKQLNRLDSKSGKEHLLKEVLSIIYQTLKNADDVQIYTSGATNIFKYPELSDSEIARDLITTLGEKESLASLITRTESNADGIQFYIGEESPVKSMKDCSVVTATYELGNGISGTIGIIGPKRMDYEMVVETLNSIRLMLDDLFEK